MAVKLGDAFVALGTKDELDKGLNAARTKVNGFITNLAQGIAQGMGQALAQGIGNLIRAGVDEIGKSITAADNLNEAIIRTQKVFGDSSPDILAWGQTTAKALGISESAALNNASALGSMFAQMGTGREEAAAMSKQLIIAATDIAAFSGGTATAESVLETFSAAFRQEYDSLQRYLPAISDAAIKQQALADTGKESAEQLTAGDKTLATHTLILEQATLMQGAFADAVERGAAAQDVFAARMEDARADLGQVGLVIKQEFFETLNELLDQMGFYGENIVEQLVVGLTKGLVAITPFLAQLRGVFVDILQPGSPPKLLPELTEWGKSAMQEYLRGWTLADFDALRSVGSIIESVVRSFAGSGEIKETDLVSRVFGTQRTIAQAVREFRQLGEVSEATLGSIADAAGPAGTEVAGLVREYFQLQRATKEVQAAQDELNGVTRRYADALDPINQQLDGIRDRQREIEDNQTLEDLGKVLKDPRAEASERELARLKIEEIQLEKQGRAIEEERDIAVDAAQAKINAAQAEADAQQKRFSIFQQALEQQQQTNALIEEEIALRTRIADEILAAEEKARRELEAKRRQEEVELERIADAQLGYRLQLADTAGDLEIMRAELAKVAVGSAEYYQILTDIAQLEERLADERDRDEKKDKIEKAGDSARENKPYIDEFAAALDAAADAIFGKGEPAKLTPFWSGVVETIKDIQDAVEIATPIVKDFLGLFTDDREEILTRWKTNFATWGTDLDAWFLAEVLPVWKTNLVAWGTETDAWFLNEELPRWKAGLATIGPAIDAWGAETGPIWLKNIRAWGADTDAWFLNEVLPLWGTGLDNISDAIDAWGLTMVEKGGDALANFWQGIWDWIDENWGLNISQLQERWDELLFGGPQTNPSNPAIPKPKGGPFHDPSSGLFPNSGNFPGIAPQTPLLAGASSSTVSGDTNYIHFEQVIGANADLGGIRQAAESGIRDALIARRLT